MKPALIGALVGIVAAASTLLWSCTVDRASEDYKCSTTDQCPPDRVCLQGYCVIGQRPADARLLDAAVCPAICGGTCDFQKSTCSIIGTGSGNVTCPAGWNCTIECGTPGACGAINCSNAASCDVLCAATNACLGITCNTKDCKIACSGQRACGNIACTTGDCNVTCAGGSACGNIACTTGDCTASCSGGSAACGALSCGTGACSATCTGAEPACKSVSCANSCKCDVGCDGTTNACPAQMFCPQAPAQKFCTTNGSNGQPCDSGFAAQCNNC